MVNEVKTTDGSSFANHETITLSDDSEDNYNHAEAEALYVGGVGNVSVVSPNGQVAIFTFTSAGYLFQKSVRVNSTLTTVAAAINRVW